MSTRQAYVEATPHFLPLREDARHSRHPILRNEGIGMKKEQNIAIRPASALIHLSCPPRPGRTGKGGEGTRHFEAFVPAAAIDDDQLVRRAPQRPEIGPAALESGRIIKHRDDDGEPRIPGSGRVLGAQARAPPQLLPCPAVHP